MTKEEAQSTVDKANEIEDWLKSEFPDIHVEHLRDCGTKMFWFKHPTKSWRQVGLMQIPITTETYYDIETDTNKVTMSFNKVILNAMEEEYPMDVFYKIFTYNKQFIRDYFDTCRKLDLARRD
jgi:hypothetical protein